MGRYKSYLTMSKKKGVAWGGGVEATFGQCPKDRRFILFSSLSLITKHVLQIAKLQIKPKKKIISNQKSGEAL